MQHILVTPMNDPEGTMFAHLQQLTPLLKTIFAKAFVSIPATTIQKQADYVAWIESEPFFVVQRCEGDPPVGHYFADLYRYSARHSQPDDLLHLCYIDRLAFALETDYREACINDIRSVSLDDAPLIFERSAKAWDTHPQNYREIEHMVTRVGELLFGKSWDLGWCHLVATPEQLNTALESIDNPNISMVAEIVIGLRAVIDHKAVDWLAWEDPYIFNADAETLKAQREASQQEVFKRLAYAVPMMQHLYETAKSTE